MNWIPCSERMPDLHQRVLAYSNIRADVWCLVFDGDYWYWAESGDVAIYPDEWTHWMPLPPPPDAEQRKPASVINPGWAGPAIG